MGPRTRQLGGQFPIEFGLFVDAPASHKLLPAVALERT